MNYKSAIDLRPGDTIYTTSVRYVQIVKPNAYSLERLGIVDHTVVVGNKVKIYFHNPEHQDLICLKLDIRRKVVVE